MKKNIVIALGGNAILQPGQKGCYAEQLHNVEITCDQIVELVKKGYNLAIAHGNGPQVGNIIVQNEAAQGQVPPMPLHVLGAESQGMIGYMIQNRLLKSLRENGLDKEVATVITQVEVAENDDAFLNPSKPVGMFFSKEEAHRAMIEKNEIWIEDSGRGWRKAVASPKPKDIVEKKAIKEMLHNGVMVISAGGGGIPVIKKEDGSYEGIEAVIDKDLAAEKLACEINADILMILTDVPNVMLNYKQENEVSLKKITVEELKKYFVDGHFKKGSMEPKVKACIGFVEATKKKAIITSLNNVNEAIEGKTGTIITYRA